MNREAIFLEELEAELRRQLEETENKREEGTAV